jgi:hypothetical protein
MGQAPHYCHDSEPSDPGQIYEDIRTGTIPSLNISKAILVILDSITKDNVNLQNINILQEVIA